MISFLAPSQWLRHPLEPSPPDPVLRRHPLPRLPPHELRRELRLHLHLVGQAAEDRQPVQQAHGETGRQEGAVNHSGSLFSHLFCRGEGTGTHNENTNTAAFSLDPRTETDTHTI